MTDEELAELERLCAAATPGPWYWNAEDEEMHTTVAVREEWPPGEWYDRTIVLDGVWWNTGDAGVRASESDIAFIAAARTALPRLIAEVRRLRGHPTSPT